MGSVQREQFPVGLSCFLMLIGSDGWGGVLINLRCFFFFFLIFDLCAEIQGNYSVWIVIFTGEIAEWEGRGKMLKFREIVTETSFFLFNCRYSLWGNLKSAKELKSYWKDAEKSWESREFDWKILKQPWKILRRAGRVENWTLRLWRAWKILKR